MTSKPQQEILRRFITAYGIVAFLLYCLLMVMAFPWWQAANRPVVITMGADDSSRIHLGYSAQESALPLVAVGGETPFHWTWATELPPRKEYDLFLEFPEGSDGEVILKGVSVIRLSPEKETLLLDLANLEAPEDGSIRLRKLGTDWGILARPGAMLDLPDGVVFDGLTRLPVPAWFKDWVGATWSFLLYAGIGLLVLVTALRFPNGIESRRRRIPIHETAALVVGLVAGSAVHLQLVRNSLPGLVPYQSAAYLTEALTVATASSPTGDAIQYILNPLPGYPLFLGSALPLLEGDLNSFILLQGAILCIVISVLACSCRRFVPGYLLGIFAFVAMLSPASVWASRQISEASLFASAWNLALAAFIFLWQRSGTARLGGWVLFGLVVTAASCIHKSGMLLLVLPLFMLTGAIWWGYSNRGAGLWRIPTVWATVGQVAIPVAMAGGLFAVMSWMDARAGASEDIDGEVHLQCAHVPFYSGTFDIRAVGTGADYEALVNARVEHGFAFTGWDLREQFLDGLTASDKADPRQAMTQVDSRMAAFNRSIAAAVPLQLKLAALGRMAGWGLVVPQVSSFSLEPVAPSYQILNTFPDMESEAETRRQLARASAGSDLTLRLSRVNSNPWIFLYNRSVVVIYPWLYRALFFGSLVAWMLAISEQKYLSSALLLPLLLMIVYRLVQLHFVGQHLQVLDATLWAALICSATAVSGNALQVKTAEDDRRCLPPVKPKRLLTRHSRGGSLLP